VSTQTEETSKFACSIGHSILISQRRLLLASFVPVMLCHLGCAPNVSNSRQSQTEVPAHGLAYQRDYKYKDLRWLAESFLSKGLTRAAVERVMGAGNDPPTGPADATRVYHTLDGRLTEGLLVIHYVNGSVEAWEWADE
jgi:hypothetical protein